MEKVGVFAAIRKTWVGYLSAMIAPKIGQTMGAISNRSHRLANLWRDHGTKIPDPSLTYGSEYSHLFHTTLCNDRWNPIGAHLPE